jgi:hypothetical protein
MTAWKVYSKVAAHPSELRIALAARGRKQPLVTPANGTLMGR